MSPFLLIDCTGGSVCSESIFEFWFKKGCWCLFQCELVYVPLKVHNREQPETDLASVHCSRDNIFMHCLNFDDTKSPVKKLQTKGIKRI